jgi:DNA-binding PadR family transcriptional regulator
MKHADDVLSRSGFLILLALADQPRHGLGIVENVEVATEGRVKLGPGTLYGTLQKLVASGYIREAREAPDPTDDDPRRRYYRLTPKGSTALRLEASKMYALVEVAVQKHILEEGA